MTSECEPSLECRDTFCAVPLVALGGTFAMTSECEPDLTCYDMTCMDIPAVAPGDACTMDVECGNI